ncbi:PREDICTED: uncharacterized protein LOC106146594 [Chinchilla lanigera]|uniref:uncharacterized protein LOC106146594 n=1 Tax=Chinchilla lanigera TaxID=34839 RepID=UPI0006977DDF|nr:PREDICTED: uncharacterized protein LOC106146594 [Chinchilla lanigera]
MGPCFPHATGDHPCPHSWWGQAEGPWLGWGARQCFLQRLWRERAPTQEGGRVGSQGCRAKGPSRPTPGWAGGSLCVLDLTGDRAGTQSPTLALLCLQTQGWVLGNCQCRASRGAVRREGGTLSCLAGTVLPSDRHKCLFANSRHSVRKSPLGQESRSRCRALRARVRCQHLPVTAVTWESQSCIVEVSRTPRKLPEQGKGLQDAGARRGPLEDGLRAGEVPTLASTAASRDRVPPLPLQRHVSTPDSPTSHPSSMTPWPDPATVTETEQATRSRLYFMLGPKRPEDAAAPAASCSLIPQSKGLEI